MEQKKIVLFILITHLAAFLAGCSGNKNSGNNDSSDLWNKLSSYFRPPAEYENVYGIFALLYYIIMGIQSEPLKTGKDDELKSRTDG